MSDPFNDQPATEAATVNLCHAAAGFTVPVMCEFTGLVSIGDLKPNPRNPYKHPEEQIKALAKILRHQGWRSPITVSRRSGLVVVGHGRLEAAKFLELDKVPIDYQDFATDVDEWAHLIADNRIHELSEIDQRAVGELLEKEIKDKIDPSISGYKQGEMLELIAILEPVADTGEKGSTPEERLAQYNTSTIRQIVLVYPQEQQARVLEQVEHIRKALNLEDNTSAVTAAIEKMYMNLLADAEVEKAAQADLAINHMEQAQATEQKGAEDVFGKDQ